MTATINRIPRPHHTTVGSTDKMTQEMWVYDDVSDNIVKRMVTYVPGLYKIFDEIIVNAADNKQRDSNMSKLKVRFCLCVCIVRVQY